MPEQGRCKLVVLALKVGGRCSTATQIFLRDLARGRALASPSQSHAPCVWPAKGPSAVRESLSYQLMSFWNPRKLYEHPKFYTQHLDVATTLAEGFRYLSYEDDVLVSKWLGSCAAALEAGKSAAASRILGVDKKGQFVMSRDKQLRSSLLSCNLAVASHWWLASLDPVDLLRTGV